MEGNSESGKRGMGRRDFLKGALAVGATGAVSSLAACTGADSKQASGGTQENTVQETVHTWEKKPEPITDIKESKTADIIIVGAGVAGLVAAAKASELGSVIVIEKGSTVATVRECEWAFDSQVQRDAGMTFTEEERQQIIGDFIELSRYSMPTQENVASFVDNSGPLVDWIKPILERDPEINVSVEPLYGRYGISYGSFGFPVQDWFIPLVDYIEENGTEFYFNTPAVQLVQADDGSITGVIGEDKNGGHIEFKASKGVVLCAGGFGLNEEMMEYFYPRSEYIYREIQYPTHTGDGLIMAMQIGADMDAVAWGDSFIGAKTDLGNQNEIKITNIYTPAYGCLPLLYVDIAGKRCLNEKGRLHGSDKIGWMADVDIANGILWQPEGRIWSIFDDAIDAKLEGVVDNSSTTSRYPNKNAHSREKIERDVDNGVTLMANSIEELAKIIEVDPQVLKATVARYNEMCAAGYDSDFFKEANWLHSIDKPPYYAVPVIPYPCCTRGGLRIGPTGRVLDKQGQDIKGLYASGLTAGAMFGLNTLLGSASVTQLFGWLGVQDAHGVI